MTSIPFCSNRGKYMLIFKAKLEIIGINPFVFVPPQILAQIFEEAKKDRGTIPVCGTVSGKSYTQTLLKYKGEWRLYINTVMLKKSPKRVGETIEITIAYDPDDRTIHPHPRLVSALSKSPKAKKKFESLSSSLQKEIIRYIAQLKTDESIIRNVQKAIDFLNGKTRFIGRDPIR